MCVRNSQTYFFKCIFDKAHAVHVMLFFLGRKEKDTIVRVGTISLSKTTALTLQKEQFEKMVGYIGHYTDMASQILQTHTASMRL